MDNDLELVAKRRVQARLGFFTHLAIYLTTNLGLFAIWMISGGGYPWFLWPLVCWGIGIVGHAITLVIGPDTSVGRRAIDRELRRMRAFEH